MKSRKVNIMLTGKIMQNHVTSVLEIKLLLQNSKRTKLYCIMIQILILLKVQKVIRLLLESMVIQ